MVTSSEKMISSNLFKQIKFETEKETAARRIKNKRKIGKHLFVENNVKK